MDYKNAGVDIEAGYKSVELMKKHIQQTMREEVLGGIGGFSGAFSLEKSMYFNFYLYLYSDNNQSLKRWQRKISTGLKSC